MTEQNFSHFERERIIWESPLSKDEKFTLIALNSFVGADGRCFPKNSKLAGMLSVPVSTARRYLQQLAKKGAIAIERRYRDNGSETSSHKIINFAHIKAMAPCSSVSNPLLTSEQGEVFISEQPPCSSVSNQELSNRTIQKEKLTLTTTREQAHSGESSSSRGKKMLPLSEGSEPNSQQTETRDYRPVKADGSRPLGNGLGRSKKYSAADFELAKELAVEYVARSHRWAPENHLSVSGLVDPLVGHTRLSAEMAWIALIEQAGLKHIHSPQAYFCGLLKEWACPSPKFIADCKASGHDLGLTAEGMDYLEKQWNGMGVSA